MEYPCTWWVSTGKHTKYDESGVAQMIYRNMETGELCSKLPPGALYESEHGPRGFDGKSVVCVVPYHREGVNTDTTHWYIDSRASNCTMPDDSEHRCWVRHGTVGERIHVDKNGCTCRAGAGSIGVSGFHGFLHGHVLRSA